MSLEDGHIDWTADADTVGSLIRGVTPEPGAFTTVDDALLKILDAAISRSGPRLRPGELAQDGKRILIGTATHPLELLRVHPAGRKAMAAADWWRGRSGPGMAQ